MEANDGSWRREGTLEGDVAVTHVISCWPFQGLGADSEMIGSICCVNDMCKTETLDDSNVQMMELL